VALAAPQPSNVADGEAFDTLMVDTPESRD
jgi:hypothetical protein